MLGLGPGFGVRDPFHFRVWLQFIPANRMGFLLELLGTNHCTVYYSVVCNRIFTCFKNV